MDIVVRPLLAEHSPSGCTTWLLSVVEMLHPQPAEHRMEMIGNSPAAYTSGSLVRQLASTRIPLSTTIWLPSAASTAGAIPIPTVRLIDLGDQVVGVMHPGQSVRFTFDRAGTYQYDCSFHPQNMKGTVVVTGT